ncbi:MAG: ornithine cyclodeaminase family protein [Spirochaetaceae bacterium]|jgi:ornithine cyclodeaminase|nr:ornithine cyclodeaminase family protein [Spirochaetaceae bacterium]
MRIIDGAEITRLLDEKSCMEVMKKTLIALEEGRGIQFLRTPHQLPGGGIFAFMPAYLDGGCFGAKVLTVFHGNRAAGYPSHQGFVLLFEGRHGSPVALLDAAAITRIRTGAVSAAATDLLAKEDAGHLALLGCGEQAHSHLRAIRHVRALSLVTVWDIDPSRSEAFARSMAAETGLRIEARPGPQEALEGADIICTLTPSRTPILEAPWVKAGAHINAVGACRPTDRELPSALVAQARVYGDSRESVLHEAGDFLIPLNEGLFGEDHLRGTIGGLALGRMPGRTADRDITIFEALGLAAEDIAAAGYVCAALQADPAP